jgi:hypothetical protein
MINNFTSGEEYANVMIQTMKENEGLVPPSDRMPDRLFEIWTEKIKEKCVENYGKYILGQLEDYMLTVDDMEVLYKESIRILTDESLENLLDKGLIEMSVGENGDILYGLSEKGKNFI